MGDAIVINGISKTYRSGGETVKALDNVSLAIREGEIFGLLGPNGAGKTSLISILAGILAPDAGYAEVVGLNCSRQAKKAQEVLNVVSGFTGVIYSLSVDEALMYYSLLYNVRDAKKKIASVVKLVGLEKARHLEADDLSSGMKQRYQIAKALLSDPCILILDEPTVGLDVESAITIRDIVKRLRKEGRTILLTTHNMFEAEELCDRIAFINHGKILVTGTVEQLKEKLVRERTIEVNCSDSEEVVRRLSQIRGVKAEATSQRLAMVSVDSYARMKDIMSALAGVQSEIYNLSALEPTLEETYLRLMSNKAATGRGPGRRPSDTRPRGRRGGIKGAVAEEEGLVE